MPSAEDAIRRGDPFGRRGRVVPARASALLAIALAAACTDAPRVVDALDPARHVVLGGGPVTGLASAPDGTLYATTRTDVLRRAPDGSAPWTTAGLLPFHPIALSAGGRGIVVRLTGR